MRCFQQCEQAVAQRLPGLRAHREKVVQHRLRAGRRSLGSQALQAGAVAHSSEVDELVADRDATAEGFVRTPTAEHRERQVLDREVAAGRVRRGEPTAARGVVGVVEWCGHMGIFRRPRACRRRSPRLASGLPRRRGSSVEFMAQLDEGEQLAPRGQEFRALLGAELFARARNLEVALRRSWCSPSTG
jgi:hypothetical protein